KQVPVYVDLNKLVRYHFGVFSFTGGGKSNLLSNLFRRIIYHSKDTKLVIFDISCEYPFLLADVFSDPKIKSKIILEEEAKTSDDFARSIVKPRDFEEDARANEALKQVYDNGNVTFIQSSSTSIPTYATILSELRVMRERDSDKPTYIHANDEIRFKILDWIDTNNKSESDVIDEPFVDMLSTEATTIMDTFKVFKGAGLSAWATTRHTLKDQIQRARQAKKTAKRGVTVSDIRAMLSGPERVVCISIAEPEVIRDVVIALTGAALRFRKKTFEIKPQILFVFDEAQEFIPSSASGQLLHCSKSVERLLRQGRKYGLGGAIATQRIAYLNTNIMQQLHTFFVGTLPRPYDRTVVSSSFQIDISILDKTLEFPPGSWLLSSYIATGLDSVPIFVKADNSEDVLEFHLQQLDMT
ncbi:MAG: ATP-binding protein, partial [Candidatus Thorarchaeota archaeon]